MKPLVYTTIIILVIVSAGIFTVNMLKKDAEALHNYMLEMESYINAEQWEEASKSGKKLHAQWEKYKKVWPMLIDHLEIDNININLSEFESYLDSKDKIQSLSKLSVLKILVRHIPERESFILQNIL